MLIHSEQVFAENIHTIRGQTIHAHVDDSGFDTCGNRRIVRALPLFSDRLGLSGRADIVEFLADGTPYPIEYKYGPRRVREHDDIQLTAQAICLEDMTGKQVRLGAVYHATSRRRREVAITDELRSKVSAAVSAVRAMLDSCLVPVPVNDARCQGCSMCDVCQPAAVADGHLLELLRGELFLIDGCDR